MPFWLVAHNRRSIFGVPMSSTRVEADHAPALLTLREPCLHIAAIGGIGRRSTQPEGSGMICDGLLALGGRSHHAEGKPMSNHHNAHQLHQWGIVYQDAYQHTYRMRVPGGWLYRHHTGTPSIMTMALVPDRRVRCAPVSAGQPDRRKTPAD